MRMSIYCHFIYDSQPATANHCYPLQKNILKLWAIFIVGILLLIICLLVAVFMHRRRRRTPSPTVEPLSIEMTTIGPNTLNHMDR